MRKVINMLQTCSMMSNKITEDIVNNSLGYPKRSEIEIIYNSLIKENLNKSHKLISTLKNKEGYSLNDLLNCVFKRINEEHNQKKLSDKIFGNIINNLAVIEYNLINNMNDTIQTSSFIGVFKNYT